MLDIAITRSAATACPGVPDNTLIAALPVAAYTCDYTGLITACNPPAIALWGRTPRLNNNNERFCGAYQRFTLEGTPLERQHSGMAQALASNSACEGYEMIIERPDGTRARVLAYANPLQDAAGNLLGTINLLVDITAQKPCIDNRTQPVALTEQQQTAAKLARITSESERLRRLYETILAHVPDLVYIFDLDHRFSYANNALLTMWGKTWDEAIGKNCLELGYEPWHAAKHDREIDQVIATKQPLRDEVPFLGAQGLRIYDYIFVPVMGADGEVEAIAGATRDITERKKLEQELQFRVEETALADRKKDEFIALLAHELRNPLAPVRNGLRIMEFSNDAATIAEVRTMMDRQLGHMVRLIDDLLDVSRLNRNKLQLQKNRVSLTEVLDSAIESVRPAIDAAGHEFVIALAPGPIYLNADLTRLAQVFSNLLSNSAKYTKPGGRIWLTTERRADNEVVVAVRDNGIGIPEHELPTIFDMFSQVSQNQSSNGLGIGLALVKTLVGMHDGRVLATSAGINEGTTFTVHLPILNDYLQPKSDAVPEHFNHLNGFRKRILVADDNHDACASMAMLLDILGNEVRTAHDGLEALAVAEDFQPDIILMDIGMPYLNGHDTTRRIRARPWGKQVTIVAITGWGQDDDRSQSRAAGCDAHLVKPVNLPDLETLLTSLATPGNPADH